MNNKEELLSEPEIRKLYRENSEFKDYVNKYIVQHNISLKEGLRHKIVNYAAQNILGTLKVGDNLYV